jgi:hypothetical protein
LMQEGDIEMKTKNERDQPWILFFQREL